MAQQLHTELTRIADGDGAGAASARIATGNGPLGKRLRAAMRALAEHRGPDSSTCPSDAARAVGGQTWRELMDDARASACELALSGDFEITQGSQVMDPDSDWHGPIRIRARGGSA